MRPHLTTIDALRMFTLGRNVPPGKFGALIRMGFVTVRGHGKKARYLLTGAGERVLADQGSH